MDGPVDETGVRPRDRSVAPETDTDRERIVNIQNYDSPGNREEKGRVRDTTD